MLSQQNPKVGVGVILVSGSEILLAQRINSHGEGSWTTPGGHLDFQEKVSKCAIRETKEESDISLAENNIVELGFTEDAFPDENKHYITCFVMCRVDKTTCVAKRKEENKFATEWQWFDIQSLPAPLFIPVANALNKFRNTLFPQVTLLETKDAPSSDARVSTTQEAPNKFSRIYRSNFWNQAAQGVGEFKSPIQFEDPINIQEFSKYVDKNAVIVDFGCGYGRIANTLHENGFQNTTGIDFSQEMIERGKTQYPALKDKLRTLSSDYQKLPFENHSVDAMTIFTVLNAIPTHEELLRLFQEFRRILKPNGILYIYEFLITQFERDVKRYNQFQTDNTSKQLPYGMFNISSGAIIRHFKKEDIEKYMDGFKVLWHAQHEFVSMNKNPCLQGQWISRNTA